MGHIKVADVDCVSDKVMTASTFHMVRGKKANGSNISSNHIPS